VIYASILSSYTVRVAFKRDVALAPLNVSYGAGVEADVPLYLAIKLDEMGVAEIVDWDATLQPGDIAALKYVERRESYPSKLPDRFYPRVKLTMYLLSKRGDLKTLRALAQEVRELVIERVRKMAALVAARPDVVNEQSFLERLEPEERALLTSVYTAVVPFILSVI
jgi:DNA replication factor GINS